MGGNDYITIGEILEKESQLFYAAESKYGDFFRNAANFNGLLQNFIKEHKTMSGIFAIFLSELKKHNILALLSVVRLHHIQAMLNLRQVLEAGANAAYALGNPNQDDFAKDNDLGILDSPQKLTDKRYKWLEKNYSAGSSAIKNMKDSINKSCAHSNITYATKNIGISKNDEQVILETPFFDDEDENLIKTDLWMIGNISLILMALFNDINRKSGLLIFTDVFIRDLLDLEKENLRLKENILKSTFKKVEI